MECYKARLIIEGYTQDYKIDYEETFSPVAYITSIRSLLTVVTAKQWKLF